MMRNEIFNEIDGAYSDMVEIRRYLHQYPELSFEETETAAYIASFYEKLGLPYETEVGGNGVVARIEGGKPGKTVGLRADFDALPIQEENDIPYKSKNPGVMHACGHDGHTATLLTVASTLQKYQQDLPGTVVFIHQHAEEYSPGGAKPMIESGCLDGVDAVFGTHLWATTPLGTLETSTDAFMVGADRFEITIQGEGGHGGYPHETKDSLVAGADLVSELQNIVSRRIDPFQAAVLTIGVFEAGSAFNVIAGSATLKGTVRYLDKHVQDKIISEMERTTKGVSEAHGVSYEFNYDKGYPPLINHEKEAQRILDTATDIEEIDHARSITAMAAEDFAYYMQERPGAYFFTGAAPNEKPYPHHHPKFNIDERALPVAAKTLVHVYLTYQASNI